MSVRLAQTFGTLVPASKNRVFAQLLRSALGWRPRHSLEEMFDRMAPCLGPCR